MAEEPVRTSRSLFQRLVLAFVSAETARDMEAHSRAWKLVCSGCGGKTSIWEAGGIRYKSKGKPTTLTILRCSTCGKRTTHRLEHEPVTRDPT